MGFLNILISMIDPFGVIRKHLVHPTIDLGQDLYEHYRNKTKERVTTARDIVLRFGIVSFAVAIILWSAVFMYVAFYYAYMPSIAHIRPVYMQFEGCQQQTGQCSYPQAHVSLTKKQQLLMVGQAYKVLVNIDMPESPQNLDLGMFMVCADMRDQKSLLRGHSCRSAMLRYKSPLVRTITTWVLSPLFIFGLKEELQQVPVELFTHYEEEQLHPVTDVYIEIQSQNIQFYSVSLHITADFTGLRYIMFHWPVLSAVMGISSNLFFILIIFTLSWYHWSDTTWIQEARNKYRKNIETTSLLSESSKNSLDDNNSHIFEDITTTQLDEDDDDDKSDDIIEDIDYFNTTTH